MTNIPAVHLWNLSHYARRRRQTNSSSELNEFFWSYLDNHRTSLKLIMTPALQLIVLSSDQCIEEILDIWLLLSCTTIYVREKSILFRYFYPSTSNRRIRYFRLKFIEEKDLNDCLKVLKEYFPIEYADLSSSQPTLIQSIFFQAMKDTLTFEQSTAMNLRNDFIRQYLSTCLIDPAFFSLVNRNEELLKNLLT